MLSIHERKSNDTVIAVVSAAVWFGDLYANEDFVMPYFIQKTDFVVCRWFDFHDGVSSHIEGKQTIAICKEMKDAKAVYDLQFEFLS